MKHRYAKSLKLWKESGKTLVPGSTTISKHPKLYTYGSYPIYLESGRGAVVTDVDGNSYIDFQSALGAIVLGIAYEPVTAAIKAQLDKGSLFSLATPLPVKLAQLLTETIPSAEMVRVLRNGSDATSAAVRIARAYTGRNVILSCHFHGWHDWFYVTTSMNSGIPAHLKNDIHEFAYNDIASLEQLLAEHKDTVAAVIMEPVHLEAPTDGYLNQVKELAHRHGALLIFDEVVTGFRFGLGGAQQRFGVTPDLTCLAKALANGAPLSALVGSRAIMTATESVITSMTYGEETLAIASAIATIGVMRTEPVADHIWRLGSRFQSSYNQLAVTYGISTRCVGLPPRMELTFGAGDKAERLRLKAYFLQETAAQGMLFGNMIFMTYSHTEDQIDQALAVCESVFKQMQGISSSDLKLTGEPPAELW